MKIGIFSKSCSTFFCNGCNQQVVFLYELLQSIEGNTCYIILDSQEDFLNYNVIHANTEFDKLLELNMIINLSARIVNIDNLILLQLGGVKIIWYNCGNEYYIFQEDILFDTHKYIQPQKMYSYLNYYDQIWSIPNYKKDRYFYETIYNISMKTVPYLWNSTVVDTYSDIEYDYQQISYPIKYIIIAEPNLQMTKTCLIPLLICERLYTNGYTNIKIIVLSQLNTTAFKNFLDNLTIYRDKKIKLYDRTIFFNIIKQLKKQHVDIYILSHQRDNPLNFLHLETLYLKYPLIHNCELYKEAGYYYSNIKEGEEKILHAFSHHHTQIEDYDKETQKILFRYSPKNIKNKKLYEYLIQTLLYYDYSETITNKKMDYL